MPMRFLHQYTFIVSSLHWENVPCRYVCILFHSFAQRHFGPVCMLHSSGRTLATWVHTVSSSSAVSDTAVAPGSTDSRRFSWAIILTKLLQYSIFFSDGRLRHLAFVLGSHSWCKSWLSKAGSLSKGLVTLKTWMPCCPSLVCLYAVSLEGSHRKPPVELQKRSCPYSGHWS